MRINLLSLLTKPWAIVERHLAFVAGAIQRHFDSEATPPSAAEFRVTLGMQAEAPPVVVYGAVDENGQAKKGEMVAVIPFSGMVVPKGGALSEFFGAAPLTQLLRRVAAAAADPNIKAIVIDVDSPGGMVSGVDEAAAFIRRARAVKPIIAVSNYLMASAAYYVASGASEIVASPSSEVGSIGVVAFYADVSEAFKKQGVAIEVFRKPAAKAEMSGVEPLTDEARDHFNASMAQFYDMFVAAVAKGRGVQASKVRRGYGEGRLLTAADALAAGMVDRIATLDETLATVLSKRYQPIRTDATKAPVDDEDVEDVVEELDAMLESVVRDTDKESGTQAPEEATSIEPSSAEDPGGVWERQQQEIAAEAAQSSSEVIDATAEALAKTRAEGASARRKAERERLRLRYGIR